MQNILNLTEVFRKRTVNTFSNSGKKWLAGLPQIIAECEKRFALRVSHEPLAVSFSYVAEARTQLGDTLIAKFAVPSPEVTRQIQALECMAGRGIVRLLASAPDQGFVLLERCQPGETLSTILDEAVAMQAAVSVMRTFRSKPSDDHDFPTTQQWFTALDKPPALPSTFAPYLIDKARQVAQNLHQDADKAVLLHGDLHHFNILSASREPWLAIDPKGVLGEPVYEVGALLRNPIPMIATSMDTKKILGQRVAILSELLEFDRQKMMAWGFAQAVLAAVWSVEGKSEDWVLFLKCAEALSKFAG